MAAVKELKLGELYYEISRHNPPALAIQPGETVRVETEDTFNGLVRQEGDRRDLLKKPQGNPQSGPIWVEGAEKGDTLAVGIERIEARIGQAATDMTWARRGLSEFLGMEIPVNTRVCPVRDGKVWWSPTVALLYEPMIGTIACAPEFGAPTTSPAGDYGGNMDLKEVTEGNTVYLPVYVDGALLHLGDAHAAQGAGELCGTALEMPATVTITVDLLKGKTIPRPRIRSQEEIMCVAAGRPMERSVTQAYADLILWMEEEFDVPRWDGLSLLTMVGEISVGYHFEGTVAAKVRLEYLEAAGKPDHQ
jgi:acetamidase/formamidase